MRIQTVEINCGLLKLFNKMMRRHVRNYALRAFPNSKGRWRHVFLPLGAWIGIKNGRPASKQASRLGKGLAKLYLKIYADAEHKIPSGHGIEKVFLNALASCYVSKGVTIGLIGYIEKVVKHKV